MPHLFFATSFVRFKEICRVNYSKKWSIVPFKTRSCRMRVILYGEPTEDLDFGKLRIQPIENTTGSKSEIFQQTSCVQNREVRIIF